MISYGFRGLEWLPLLLLLLKLSSAVRVLWSGGGYEVLIQCLVNTQAGDGLKEHKKHLGTAKHTCGVFKSDNHFLKINFEN